MSSSTGAMIDGWLCVLVVNSADLYTRFHSPLLPLGCAYCNVVVTDIPSHCLELLAGQLLRQDVLTVQQLSGSQCC